MSWIIAQLTKFLIKWCEKRGRVYKIVGGLKSTTIYMVKYVVVKNPLFCIYIHRFMRSDADDPHDHPWNFVSYILKGTYTEHCFDINKPVLNKNLAEQEKHKALSKLHYISYWTENKKRRNAGSLGFRSARIIHRVVLDRSYEMNEIEDAPLTICFMGRKRRHWGFWPYQDGGSVFVDWRKYLNIKPGDPRIEGSE